jgi:hypothetical protein
MDRPLSITSRRISSPENGPSHPAGDADHRPQPVSDGGDAVQGPFDAGPVIVAETADPGDNIVQILAAHRHIGDNLHPAWQAYFRASTKVENDLDQLIALLFTFDRAADLRRQDGK